MISMIGSLLKLVFVMNFGFIAGCYNIIRFTLFSPVIGLLYPLYATMRAIESREGDDKKWLTYWVIYSFITLIELTFYSVIQWIPMWSYVKLFLSWWLVLPGFNGASQLYDQFVRHYILNSKTTNVFLPSKKEEHEHYFPEMHVTWADTSAKYIGRSAFDDDYSYYY